MKKSLFVLIFLFIFALTAASQAGTTLSGLMGGDVTDPGNKISFSPDTTWESEEQWKSFYEGKATWLQIQSHYRSPYSNRECPSNLFNNNVSYNAAKWYDSYTPSASNPAYVTLQFPESFVLTHFTLSSGNDSMDSRNPKDWAIYGSNDGTNWTEIYHATSTDDFTTAVNTTVLYSSFTYENGKITSDTVLSDTQKTAVSTALGTSKTISTANYETPAAYSWYKLQINSVTGTQQTQLGEWELFGNTISTGRTSGNTFVPLNEMMNYTDSLVHLDAQNTATLTTDDSGNVSAWADANGNGVVFSQTNTNTQPTLTTLKIGDQTFNALDFSRCTPTEATDLQGGDNLVANKTLNSRTVIILAQNDTNINLMGIYGVNNDDGLRLNETSGLWQHLQSNDYAMDGTHTYNGLDETEFSGTLVNNPVLSQVTTKTGDSNNWEYSRLGSYFRITQHGTRGYDGKILEFILYDRALTDYETKLVNTGFAMKYGLEIANTLGVFPGSTATTAYRNDLLGIINKTIDGNSYSQLQSGEGGLGIYGKITATKSAESAFDLFLTTYETPTTGTEIYAVSNVAKDASFGIEKNAAGIKNSTYDKWAKEWYFTNKSEGEQDWDITLEFNADVANFENFDEYADSEWYLISKTEEDGEYSRVADLGSQKFNENSISFTFPASLLQTGYYTLGVMTSPELPEPAAWVMILIGIAGIWKVKFGRR